MSRACWGHALSIYLISMAGTEGAGVRFERSHVAGTSRWVGNGNYLSEEEKEEGGS